MLMTDRERLADLLGKNKLERNNARPFFGGETLRDAQIDAIVDVIIDDGWGRK
jgi:hypothetical protein